MLSKHNLLLAMSYELTGGGGMDQEQPAEGGQRAQSSCPVYLVQGEPKRLCFTNNVSSPEQKADAMGAVAGTHRKQPQERKATSSAPEA